MQRRDIDRSIGGMVKHDGKRGRSKQRVCLPFVWAKHIHVKGKNQSNRLVNLGNMDISLNTERLSVFRGVSHGVFRGTLHGIGHHHSPFLCWGIGGHHVEEQGPKNTGKECWQTICLENIRGSSSLINFQYTGLKMIFIHPKNG